MILYILQKIFICKNLVNTKNGKKMEIIKK